MVKFLIEEKADVNVKDQYGHTPLHKIITLSDQYVDSSPHFSSEASFFKSYFKSCAVVSALLIAHGAKLEEKDEEGRTLGDLIEDHPKFKKRITKHLVATNESVSNTPILNSC